MPKSAEKPMSLLQRRQAAAALRGKKPIEVPSVAPSVPGAGLSGKRRDAQLTPGKVSKRRDPEEFDDEDVVPTKKLKSGKKLKAKRGEIIEPPTKARKSAQLTPSRALARPQVKTPGAIALPLVDRTREMDRSDLVIPQLMLSQAMSEVNDSGAVPMGNFYTTTNQKSLGDEILVVIVDWRKSRSLFEQGEGVVCRSYDLIQGEGDPGILCEGTPEEIQMYSKTERGCALRLWGDDGTPPPCGEAYNYVLLICDPEDPINGKTRQAVMTLRKTQLKYGKKINSLMFDSDTQVWHDQIIQLSAKREKNSKGAYYVPAPSFYGNTEGPLLEKARRAAATLAQENVVRNSVEAAEKDDDDEEDDEE